MREFVRDVLETLREHNRCSVCSHRIRDEDDVVERDGERIHRGCARLLQAITRDANRAARPRIRTDGGRIRHRTPSAEKERERADRCEQCAQPTGDSEYGHAPTCPNSWRNRGDRDGE